LTPLEICRQISVVGEGKLAFSSVGLTVLGRVIKLCHIYSSQISNGVDELFYYSKVK